MKRFCLQVALVLSLLLNLGVLAAVGYHAVRDGGLRGLFGNNHTDLSDYLGLTDAQRSQWHEKETIFMRDLDAAWIDTRARRERMIREIFSPHPDLATIEAERAAMSRLQEHQQRRVIEQLMAERELLDERQRAALAELLIRQEPATSMEERLHGK